MNRSIAFWMAVLLGVGGVMLLRTARNVTEARRKGTEPAAVPAKLPDWLTEFSLTDQDAQPFGTSDLAGHVHVVNFFFATCPSVCRAENAKVQALCHEFGPQGVTFVGITCDPEKDTPAALREYGRLFNANHEHWKFLTGELLYIRRIGAEIFEVPVDKQTHSERLIAVDRWGKIRGRYRWDKAEEIEQLRKLLADLLNEKTPPLDDSKVAATTVGDAPADLDSEATEPESAQRTTELPETDDSVSEAEKSP